MPRKHGTADSRPASMDPTGPLTNENYKEMTARRVRARAQMYGDDQACVMLDPRDPADREAWAAWRQMIARIVDASPPWKPPKNDEKPTWHISRAASYMDNCEKTGTRWAAAERFPWELTGELPFVPFERFWPAARSEPDIPPHRRRAIAAAARRMGFTDPKEAAE